ncbi:MAG: DUF6503 family protein, partial [Bacteroidota bacterium]
MRIPYLVGTKTNSENRFYRYIVAKYSFIMLRYILFLVILWPVKRGIGQKLTGEALLAKTIAYHDPHGQWPTFSETFGVMGLRPNGKESINTIHIDLPKQIFKLTQTRDSTTISQMLNKDSCILSINGNENPSKEDKDKYRLSCKRTKTMRNYYSYLYGLPMKLNDPGTHIDPQVSKKSFNGKDYLVLKATYDEAVGKDIWYFYFDPKTYALEVYQFFHDESKNDGEYVLSPPRRFRNCLRMGKSSKI